MQAIYTALIAPESVMGKVVTIEKRGRVLTLESGRGRIVNSFLGIKNCVSYKLDTKINAIKKMLRDKPGFKWVRLFYRIFKKPFILFKEGMVRILLAGIWIGIRWDRGNRQEVESSKVKEAAKR